MIIYLLCAAISYLLGLSIILWMNYHDFKPLVTIDGTQLPNNPPPLVSICIPARNEEKTIARAIHSAIQQNFPTIEILILNDQSTDATPAILAEMQKMYPDKLSVVNGKNKPYNWLGKSWACHQLSQKARGSILFFIDADVWVGPEAVARAVASLNHYSIDFLTVWPLQKLETLWEKVVIPLVYYGLLGMLPARYVHQKPRWLPSFLEHRFAPRFAAACGQCMVFRQAIYEKIGGHQSVKNDIVEDVALSKKIKEHGFKMRMFHGKDTVWCRMYHSNAAMWHGFRKNFLALFQDSVPAFILMMIVNIVVYIFPLIIFFSSLFSGNTECVLLSGIAILLMSVHRLILAQWYHWSKAMALFHPVGVLWFFALAIQVLKDRLTGTRVKWKNRYTT